MAEQVGCFSPISCGHTSQSSGLADAKSEVAEFTTKIQQSLDKLRTDIGRIRLGCCCAAIKQLVPLSSISISIWQI